MSLESACQRGGSLSVVKPFGNRAIVFDES